MDIAKSVILITSAGTPNGRAMAEYFCMLGAKVALVDTDKAALVKSLQLCLSQGAICQAFWLDDQHKNSESSVFRQITKQLGCINVLINYWKTPNYPELLSDSSPDSLFDTSAALYRLGQNAALSMKGQDEGVIINIPYLTVAEQSEQSIHISNSFIRGLTESWACELQNSNVRVGGVLPLISHKENGQLQHLCAVNYNVINSAAYIVQNDSFNGRILEAN
ncbi:MAG: SDR family NAD(P)-dependent oxidoreductase [Vibrionaceae bacterium]